MVDKVYTPAEYQVYLNQLDGKKSPVQTAQPKTPSQYPITAEFEHRLRRSNDPVHLLMGVYKEIVPSNKGRLSNGQYRTVIDTTLGKKGLAQKLNVDKKKVHADIGAFVILLAKELGDKNLPHHQEKLLQYATKTKLFEDGRLTEEALDIWGDYRPPDYESLDVDADPNPDPLEAQRMAKEMKDLGINCNDDDGDLDEDDGEE